MITLFNGAGIPVFPGPDLPSMDSVLCLRFAKYYSPDHVGIPDKSRQGRPLFLPRETYFLFHWGQVRGNTQQP